MCQALGTVPSGGCDCPHYTDEKNEKCLASCRAKTGVEVCLAPCQGLFAGPVSPCGPGTTSSSLTCWAGCGNRHPVQSQKGNERSIHFRVVDPVEQGSLNLVYLQWLGVQGVDLRTQVSL